MKMKDLRDIQVKLREKYSPEELKAEILCDIIHILFNYLETEEEKPLTLEHECVTPPPWNIMQEQELTQKYIDVMLELKKYGGYVEYGPSPTKTCNFCNDPNSILTEEFCCVGCSKLVK